ncbi:MAG: hypothetical protein HY042_07450 [Spirochaetia bacterium]|nr:hypothetical protein [Spirochaetia bacterium]
MTLEEGEAQTMMQAPEAPAVIAAFTDLIKSERPAEPAAFTALMKSVGEKTGAKGKSLFMTIRVATTGSTHGLELPTLFAIIGCDEILKRVQAISKEAGLT